MQPFHDLLYWSMTPTTSPKSIHIKVHLCFKQQLGGGNSNIFMFTPKIGEHSQFDSYVSDGLVQPPTRKTMNSLKSLLKHLAASPLDLPTVLKAMVAVRYGFSPSVLAHSDQASNAAWWTLQLWTNWCFIKDQKDQEVVGNISRCSQTF